MTHEVNAKINLFLEILGKRADGFHELETIFLRVCAGDRMTITSHSGSSLQFSCNNRSLQQNTDTTIHRTYQLIARILGESPGITVDLDKRIPEGSGLGAGSADAACLLTWAYTELELQRFVRYTDLIRESASIGADVPFFLGSTLMLGHGIGELLTELPVLNWLKHAGILLITPPIQVSTSKAFALLDGELRQTASSTDLRRSLLQDPPTKIVLYNGFEPVATQFGLMVDQIKHQLISAGATAASLSGSGSTVFGLFESHFDAEAAGRNQLWPSDWWVKSTSVADSNPLYRT